MNIPSYLENYKESYATDPRAANMEWFRNARYGLFLHYGLYSILGRHEWVQLQELIPVAEYAKLKDKFKADKFNANEIVSFAKNCGMKYINITTRHHDCFCLWNTKETDFNSVNSPAGRDLVAELARECEKQKMGFFMYYSHGRDWKHPHAPNNDKWGGSARPKYDPPEPSYAIGDKHDLNQYLEFMKRQIAELIAIAPDTAGIWLDGVAVPQSGDYSLFKLEELYAYIRSLSPHVLVSYKQGILGTEDFFTPEHSVPTKDDNQSKLGKITSGKIVEICTTMIGNPVSWGYSIEGTHKTEEQVWEKLNHAKNTGSNLLLNTGPKGDGSLDERDTSVLLAVGEKLRANDFWNT
jgi:alpha-L-fucosidase